MGEESAGMVQSVDEVVFGMGTCYWYVVFINMTLDAEPLRYAYSGSSPLLSSQLTPTAWLLKFVEPMEPLNQGCRSSLRFPKEPGFRIPLVSDEILYCWMEGRRKQAQRCAERGGIGSGWYLIRKGSARSSHIMKHCLAAELSSHQREGRV